MLAIRAESSRLIWPAPTPRVCPLTQNTIALLLTNLATFHANKRSCNCSAVGCVWVTTLRSESCSSWLSAVCINKPEPMRLTSTILCPRSHAELPVGAGKGICNTRTLGLPRKTSCALALKLGAINTSTNCLPTASAATWSTSQLKAMMPPNAEVGSV